MEINANLNLILTLDEAMEFKRWLGERRDGYIAVDTETSGLDCLAPDAKIRLVQIGDAHRGWCIPWDTWKGLALEALNDWDQDFVLHNLFFDRSWLEAHSDFRFPVSRTFDTMIASRVIDPTRRAGLKPLATKLIDGQAYKGQRQLDEDMASNGWDWATVPVTLPSFWYYSALDTVLTSRLWDQFRKDVGPGGFLAQAYDLEMAVLDVSYKMWHKGMRVDLEYSRAQYDRMTARAAQLSAWGKTYHGGLSITSPAQLGQYFQQAGVEITEFTDTGKPKIDKDFLDRMTHPDSPYPQELADLSQAILDVRKANKFASSYFRNFIETADSNDIVRPNINTLAARTGRQSITKPALQTLPKRDKVVRNAFLPHNDDELIVSVDFDQIEARILANLSRDSQLQEAFLEADRTGGDFFTELGKKIFRDQDFTKDDPRRGLVKNVCYGKLYGAGVKKMSETAKVPFDQMQSVSDTLEGTYPGFKRFMAEVENVTMQRQRRVGHAYVELMDGRKLPVDEEHLYAGLNYTIQGSASVYFKRAQVRLDQSGWGQYALVPVHDEIVLSIPKKLIPDALVEIPEIMKDTSGGPVPYTAGGEGGFDRWGGTIVN